MTPHKIPANNKTKNGWPEIVLLTDVYCTELYISSNKTNDILRILSSDWLSWQYDSVFESRRNLAVYLMSGLTHIIYSKSS